MWTKETLKNRFDFCEGRDIMLFTSFKSFGPVEGGPKTVMDAFTELGKNVLFPSFNFQSWTESHYWDYYETPSKMGIITEFARKAFPRTFHPIYPFAVAGPDAKQYQRCNDEEAFGLGSPFNKFYLDGGLIVSVGLDDFTQTFTPVHFAEYLTGIDYRYQKPFHGIYRGFLANPKIRTFTAFVRCDDVINNPNPASEELISRGIIKFKSMFASIRVTGKPGWREAKRGLVLYSEMKDYVEGIQWYAAKEPHKLHEKVER